MKNLIVAVTAAFLFWAQLPAFAANSATAQTALPIKVGVYSDPVVPYVVAFDTTASDLTIVTPDSGKMACVVGMGVSETSATNITFKSGSTTLFVPELAANQGVYDKISNGAILCTQPGEALKIQVSVAVSNMILYIVQATRLDFTGR